MKHAVFIYRAVRNCVRSTLDMDRCAIAAGVGFGERTPVVVRDGFCLRLRGLRQQRQRLQPTSECQRRNHRYDPHAVRYDHHIHSFL
jgi:hypothetical protein